MKWKICKNNNCKRKIKPGDEAHFWGKVLCQRCYYFRVWRKKMDSAQEKKDLRRVKDEKSNL